MKTITAALLRRSGACRDQVATFRKAWPKGAPVTVAAARKARKLGLDVRWLSNLLPAPLRAEYYAKVDALLIAALRRTR